MPVVHAVLPPLIVVLVAVLANLPWGLPMEAQPFLRHLLALLPAMAAIFFLGRRPGCVPASVLFLVGLLVDVATKGPIGFWPLVYLLSGAAAAAYAQRARGGALQRFAFFAATATLSALIAWVAASAFYLRGVDPRPILTASTLMIALYPGLALVLGPLVPSREPQENARLERRG